MCICWCIKDINYEQMHGMESFKTNKHITMDGISYCRSLNYQLHKLHTLLTCKSSHIVIPACS